MYKSRWKVLCVEKKEEEVETFSAVSLRRIHSFPYLCGRKVLKDVVESSWLKDSYLIESF